MTNQIPSLFPINLNAFQDDPFRNIHPTNKDVIGIVNSAIDKLSLAASNTRFTLFQLQSQSIHLLVKHIEYLLREHIQIDSFWIDEIENEDNPDNPTFKLDFQLTNLEHLNTNVDYVTRLFFHYHAYKGNKVIKTFTLFSLDVHTKVNPHT